jgi:selenocysteine lyase/cysteine desulfurase
MPIGQLRHLFDVPDEIAYFNTAYNAPLLRASREALEQAAGAKSRPWERTAENFFEDAEMLRTLCASLFDSVADNFAIVPAASYGISTAARVLEPRLQPGEAILLLEQEFPSNVLPWRRVAAERGARIITVARPTDGNWTAAVLHQIDKSVRIAALSACHWTDGAALELAAIGESCRSNDTILVLDVTQSLGAMPLDLAAIRPDFMVAAGYKWLLCPYGFSLLYVDPRWHGERPLEEGWLARTNAYEFSRLADYSDEYRAGARRFDVGETCVTTVLPGAIAALEQLNQWGIAAIRDHLAEITGRITQAIEPLGYEIIARDHRSAHIVGVACPKDAKTMLARLQARNVYVSQRSNAIRIAPHLHISEANIDALVAALGSLAG